MRRFASFVAILFLLAAFPYSANATTCGFGSDIGGGECRGFLISGTSWTVPSDWNASAATIEAVGPGGAGGADVSYSGGAGGQGGGYGEIASPSNVSAGNTLSVQIGTGGSTNATWLKNSSGTIIVQGDYGATGSGTTGGNRSQTNIGDTTYTGGIGGSQVYPNFAGGCGGGGAGGPAGNGGSGGACQYFGGNAASGAGGAASGGANGGSYSNTSPAPSGGNNSNGTGGGAGGSSASKNGSNGTPSLGYGGAGGGAAYYEGTIAGNGAIGEEWDATHGSGGGGGGISNDAGPHYHGGAGGLYGGGGAGGGYLNQLGGTGAQGIIVITYTPGGGPPPTNSCTYSGSGDWNILGSDHCYITGNTYITGALNLIGAGWAGLAGTIAAHGIHASPGFLLYGLNGTARLYTR